MTRKTKIILAIAGGAVVGGMGVCATIFPAYATAIALVSGGVALAVSLITGISITKEK